MAIFRIPMFTAVVLLFGLCSGSDTEDECNMFYDCVRCHFYGSGPLTPEECERCKEDIHFEIIDFVDPFMDGKVCIKMNEEGLVESYYIQNFMTNGKIVIQSMANEKVLDPETSTMDTYEATVGYNRRRGDSIPEVADYPSEVTTKVTGNKGAQQGQTVSSENKNSGKSAQQTDHVCTTFMITFALIVVKVFLY